MSETTTEASSFNLVDQPWIRCRTATGELVELSLRDVLTQAPALRCLSGELPSQDLAILRILLAVLLGSVRPGRARTQTQAEELWLAWWGADQFPSTVGSYLDAVHDRFDLLDPTAPAFQVAGLTTASGNTTGLAKLIADLPANAALFTTRGGREADQLCLAEAARWLVHCQAFDPAGIKTGAQGDERVKGGKGYSMFYPAWTGNIGAVVLHGRSLFQTLMLNLPVLSSGPDDLPVWDRPPLGPAVDHGHLVPRGPADSFTWPSRRIRLIIRGGMAVDAQISNGDRLEPNDRFTTEPMCAWRLNQTQSKRGAVVLTPVRHDATKRIWQGLGPLLASSSSEHALGPAALDWLAGLVHEGALSTNTTLSLQIVGLEYGTQNSVISGAVDDRLMASVAAMTDPVLVQMAVHAAELVRSAVIQLANLASNLDRAAGGEGQGSIRDGAFELGYSQLDLPFRRWLRTLHDDTLPEAALAGWSDTVRTTLTASADQLTRDAGRAALAGREVSTGKDTSTWLDAGLATLWFRAALNKLCPRFTPDEGNPA